MKWLIKYRHLMGSLLLVVGLLVSCSPADNLGSDIFTQNIYPSNGSYVLGNSTYMWGDGNFNNIHVNNTLSVGGIDYTSNNLSIVAYGQMYNDEAASATTVITAGVYYLVTGWTAGLSYLTTLSVVGSNITINSAGIYLVSFSVGASNNGANRTVHVAVFVNGVEATNLDMEEKMISAGDVYSLGSTGLCNLSVGDVLDLRVTSSVDGDIVTFNHASLIVNRVGK